MSQTRAQYCVAKAQEIQTAIDEIVARGTKSATTSGGGASESYTGLDLPTLERMRDDWLRKGRASAGSRRHGAADFS